MKKYFREICELENLKKFITNELLFEVGVCSV